jgi:Peptidase_C39 like family
MTPTIASVRSAAQEIAKAGTIQSHQLAALSALDQALTPEQRLAFTADWRAAGSPAAAPPAARPTNPLTGFPWFPQLDNGPEGWRQCQTSSIAMCLAYLGVGNIKDDLDYLQVVRRYGDTTSQVSHQLALKALGVRARFVTNCSASQAQGEIKAGLPVCMGILHKSNVSAPGGGGHWIAAHGFDARHFVVNDPYGELDLVNGTWVRTGGNSGKGLRYSYQNITPRWQVEGAGSGWAWLFS